MLQLTFKQTNSELLVRAAASVLFGTLAKRGAKIVSISDLAEQPQYGFTASAAIEPVGPKFVRITDLQDGRIDWETVPFCECNEPEKYLLRDDDLLFARTGATTGKTHLVREPEQAVFASYLIRLRPKAGVFAGYLHAFFQSDTYWWQISEEKEGSAQPNVNGEKLAALQIPLVESKLQHAIADFLRCVRRRQDGEKVELPQLPAPLAEERRVVARIEELAAQIHEARTLRHQATEEAEALQSHVARDLFPEPTDTVVSDWVKFQTGYAFKSEWFSESGVRLARNANVGHGTLDWSETVRLPESRRAEFPRFELGEGDILITLDRPIISTGVKVARVRKEDLPCLLLQRVARAQFQSDKVLPDYFFRWLRSPHFVGAIDPGRSNGVPHISHKDIEKIPFAAPPQAEQWRIVAELDALQAEVDALKRLQAETAAELDALLPTLLDRAFKGEL